MPQLQTPRNVALTSATNGSLTVTFEDPNQSGVASYDIQFLLRTDTTQTVPAVGTPFATNASNVAVSSGNVTITGIALAPGATVTPSTYVASVVAKAQTGQTAVQDSAAGLSTFWEVAGTLSLQIGSNNLVLTADSASVSSGIYRLPLANPLVITYADVRTFVNTISAQLGTTSTLTLPATLPNSFSLLDTTTLSLEKLAVDTHKGLFALEVSVNLGGSAGWSPFTGLTVQGFGLTVLRTNGIDQL